MVVKPIKHPATAEDGVSVSGILSRKYYKQPKMIKAFFVFLLVETVALCYKRVNSCVSINKYL